MNVGTFHEPIEIWNPSRRGKPVSLDALVDTGAAFSVVPAKILRRLGIRPSQRGKFKLADGRVIERGIADALVRVRGKTTHTWIVFGGEASDPLLGAYTLEGLGLGVDNIHRNLVPIATFPLSESLRRGPYL